MAKATGKHDFTRICAECAFADLKKANRVHREELMCTVHRDLVTGDPYRVRCATARSAHGHCGPTGRLYSAAAAVQRMAAE